jgi:hypothetical protein
MYVTVLQIVGLLILGTPGCVSTHEKGLPRSDSAVSSPR